MKKKLAALALMALVLTGCGSSISEGYITAKVAEPGHYYTHSQCTVVGKVTVCTPVTTYDDPDWRFDLREQSDGIDEPRTGYVYVTQAAFDEYEVGDYFEEKK